ncbi:MAG: phage tail protein [Actinomycetota bacterium]
MASTGLLALVCALLIVEPWSAGAAPGDEDATLFPIEPCRLFDFRPGADPDGDKKTPLAAGESNVHVQQVTGDVGNCSIPSSAVAVAMNVTITDPTAQSNLRIYPADVSTVPTVSSLNWLPGQAPTPNKVDVKLSPDGQIALFNQNGTVNVLADVVAYYSGSSLNELSTTAGVPGPAGPQGPAGPGADVFGTNTEVASPGRGGECTLGEIILTAGTTSHGQVLANGQLLPINSFQALYALLGTLYGGDARTEFAVPDLRAAAPNGLTYTICAVGIFPSRS